MVNYTLFVSNNLLNNTNSSVVTGLEFAKGYFNSLPQLIFQGDLAATILALILFFIFLVVVNKLSSLLLVIIKRTIIFIITFLILKEFTPIFVSRFLEQGFTAENILIGVLGILICLLAFMIATLALFKDTRRAFRGEEHIDQIEEQSIPTSFLEITQDRSLLNVLIYLVVAEFGVFSSVTLAAPNVNVGVAFLFVFLVAAVVFISQSYHNYKVGLFHLAMVFVVGFSLSLLLGVMWGNQTLPELLSLAYFTSDSLVALITGMAVSLFAGSKH